MSRISQSEYYMSIVDVVKLRSTCVRRQVGAIAVRDGRIVATGYNGAPMGSVHCTEDTCLRIDIPSGTRHELCKAVHAEQNLVTQAALHGVSLLHSVVYVNTSPCGICTKLLINSGVRVVYVGSEPYPDVITDMLVKEKLIELVYL